MRRFSIAPALALVLAATPAARAQFTLGQGDIDGAGLNPPGSVDGWISNLVVNESQIHTNDSGQEQLLSVDGFNFFVGEVRNRLTPVVFQVNGDNDFTVVAVGTTRVAGVDYTATGIHAFPFNDGGATFTLPAGGSIAPGFLDANADGTESGSGGGVIPFNNSGDTDELWYTGGSATENSGSVVVGQAPIPGPNVLLNLVRDYQYNIEVSVVPEPATFAALLAGLAGMVALLRRRRQ